MKKITLIISLLAFLLLFLSKESFTNSGGPPQNVSGVPGSGNCTNCHTGNAQSNAPELTLTVTQNGNPVSSIVVGQTYNLTFSITTAGNKFGFQMAARLGTTSLPAGSFAAGTGTTLNGSFINHNNQGNASTTGQGRSWSFNWTAPAISGFGSVTFYASALRANQNNQNSGDQVYLKSFSFPEAVPVQTSITPNNATASACDSSQVSFDFSTTGTFNNGNVFQLQLSDIFGNFTNTTPIGTLTSTGGNNLSITGTLPQLSTGNYQLRVVSTNPVTTSANRMVAVEQLVPPVMFLFTTTFSLTNPSPNHTYQWFKNGSLIPNATNISLNPGVFGAYAVRASNTSCPTRFLFSPYDTLKPIVTGFNPPAACSPSIISGPIPLSGGAFEAGNVLTVELSDTGGQFNSNTTTLLSVPMTVIAPSLSGNYPSGLTPSSNYRLRFKSTLPIWTSAPSTPFQILAQPAKPTITRVLDTLVSSSATGNQWFRLGQGAIPNATMQRFKPTVSGQYWVLVSNSACSSPISDTIAFVGTSVVENSLDFQLIPNPAQETVEITAPEAISRQHLLIFDLSGKQLSPTIYQNSANALRIETSSLPNGVYLIQYQNQRKKLVISH